MSDAAIRYQYRIAAVRKVIGWLDGINTPESEVLRAPLLRYLAEDEAALKVLQSRAAGDTRNG